MKSVIFLFIIALSSCHVHYHIQGKEISVKEDGIKPLIISGSARLYGDGFKTVETPNSNNIAVISNELSDPQRSPNSIGVGMKALWDDEPVTSSIAIDSRKLETPSCKERGHIKPSIVMTTLMYCESYTIDTDSTTILVHPACNYDRYTCMRCLEYVDEQQKERREIIYKK